MRKEPDSVQKEEPLKAVSSYFFRLTIAKKMLLGYMSLVALLVLISVFALYKLNLLNSINESILQTDIPVIDATDKMLDTVLAQESYARRYVILRSPELLKIFWERDQEFKGSLNGIKELSAQRGFPLDTLAELHENYNRVLVQGMEGDGFGGGAESDKYDGRIKVAQEAIVGLLKVISGEALADQNSKTNETASIGSLAIRAAWALCIVGLVLSIGAATAITRNISGSIRELKIATERISEGKFDYMPNIPNQDELGDLAVAFVAMGRRLKRLEEMYLDASPLTHLPGGVAIENVLKKRIENHVPFAFCFLDMDNFKAYNDRYGYSKGNKLIQSLAGIIEKSVAEAGTADDFVGHVGGDDFVVITDLERYPAVCRAVIDDFSAAVPWFYDEEDRVRGYIRGTNRQGQDVSFPLATLSIAVVTSRNHEVENHIRVGEIAAELKEYAKAVPGSLYVVDKRRNEEARSDAVLGGPPDVGNAES